MTRSQIIASIVTSKQTNLGQVGVALVKAGFAEAKKS